MSDIEFGILGPLEVVEGARMVALGTGRQRKLLAVLLTHANEVVSSDRLIEALWGDRPPDTAGKALQGHVSQLRKAIGSAAVVTQAPGYLLRVGPDQLDADRFGRLLDEARGADPATALDRLDAALALWRGPALAEFAYDDFAQDVAARLEEQRLQALEARIDAQLALGRHVEVVGELEQLVARHPLRERLRAQLMLALYRSGRQADALAVYRDGRARMVEELGLEPGPQLQELHRAILAQDPGLASPVKPNPFATRRRRTLLVGALAGAVAAAVSIPVFALGRGGSSVARLVPANSVAIVDPSSNAVVGQIPVGAHPAGIAVGSGVVWVANVDDQSVSRIDPKAKAVIRTIPLRASPSALASDSGELWIASGSTRGSGLLTRIDAEFNSPGAPTGIPGSSTWPNVWPVVTTAFGDLWIAHTAGVVLRRDPRSGRTVATIDVGSNPGAIASGAGAVWVANTDDGTVSRIDPTNVVTATTPVGHGPSAIAVGPGGVWVAVSLDGAVARLDPASGAVTARYPVGGRPTGVAVGNDALWVIDAARNAVLRLDPKSGQLVRRIALGNTPEAITLVGGRPWVTVAARQPAVGSGPGVARFDLAGDISSTDPALAADTQAFQLLYATCAKLVNYPDEPAPGGSRLVPEVAESVPSPSADGRSYTFRIRPGFRFSPPSNQSVTAETFRYSIERSLDPRMKNGFLAQTVRDIVGVPAFASGKARHISGITAHGDTLTIRLTRAVPDFPSRISEPYFCAVPTNTPIDPKGVPQIPSAGPYYVAAQVPGRLIVLKRNPSYRGSRPHRLAEIDYTIGVSPTRTVAAIQSGHVDYVPDGVPSSENQRLLRRYGPGSRASKTGRQQYFVDPVLSMRILSLNTSRPLFADPRIRRAVNYAIDRRAIVAQEARATRFGFSAGTANDAYLPPGAAGYPGVHVYPLNRPDLAKARKLTGGKRRVAVLYTCNKQPCPQDAQIIRADLARIGIDVDVKEFTVGEVYNRISRPGEPYDLVTTGWVFDYPDPADLFDASGTNFMFSNFHDPVYTRRLAAAARLSPPARYREYAELAVDLAKNASPWVVIENDSSRDFFSARMGCQTYQPIYGMDIAALCVKGR